MRPLPTTFLASAVALAVRRCAGFLTMTATVAPPPPQTSAASAVSKLPWEPGGYSKWTYVRPEGDSHTVTYVNSGAKDKPALLLVHGFGASCYHWRYNVPELAKHYDVYAIDMLGFGQSDKPLLDYSAELWRDQVCAFTREIIGKETVVAGNSLGGYTALAAAAQFPELIRGCVLLNAAGRFDSPMDVVKEVALEEEKATLNLAEKFMGKAKEALQRAAITASFYYTKQPLRIKQVLTQVYSVNPKNVDDELVESIRFPALDPNAPEVFYRVITKNGSGPSKTVNTLLAELKTPLMLLWGEKDPWISSKAADRIQQLHPEAVRVSIDAGHCPHDEAPEAVNAALLDWLDSIGFGERDAAA
eukprot:TRINITY_DN5544_c0_g1_i1.p1 TRINITY_DN5544_c0_g1~~TRINITY_DN5544_c0_g1_i1.p1  ORF type:complete len:360 (+),score=115.52 TRINITY_DN5544_c0_g1_i1:148-1227(+)